MSQPRQVLVLADDLTGANDTAVQFARRGWRAYLALTPAGLQPNGAELSLADGPVVVARNNGTRAETPLRASELTEEAFPQSGSQRVYLKIDSTMRGSVAGQIHGALCAKRRSGSDAFVVLCPAYPAMGRTVREGIILVGGEPAHRGPAGKDPITPIATSTLTELVERGVAVSTAPTPQELAASITAASVGNDVVIVDAETEQDLVRLAEALQLIGNRALPAGSAGLALALAAVWGGSLDRGDDPTRSTNLALAGHDARDRSTIVLVSSQHRVAHDQVRATLAALPPDRVTLSSATWEDIQAPEAARTWASRLAGEPEVPLRIIVAPPLGSSVEDVVSAGRTVATALATAVVELVDGRSDRPDLLLVGGDGAAAVLRSLVADALHVTGAIVEGVPATTVVGGPYAGLGVVTKAGGFGDESTLIQILNQIDPQLVGAS